jgi:hypothetical protein
MSGRKNKDSEGQTSTKETVTKPHYSMPDADVQIIEALRFRYQKLSLSEEKNVPVDISKSEIVRAGINVLNKLNDSQFIKAINNLDKLPKGRKKSRKG